MWKKEIWYRCEKCGKRTAVKSSFCPNCGDDMGEDERQAAYAAVTHRLPNKALTREEVLALPRDESTAVWSVSMKTMFLRLWSSSGIIQHFEAIDKYPTEPPAEDTIWVFLRYPTAEDIEAARKERYDV